MPKREYLEVDIPLNLKEGGMVGNEPGHDARIISHGIDVLRDQANRIIRTHVKKYRARTSSIQVRSILVAFAIVVR